ncbi:MAG: hypothetical protein GY860_10515 [Desulfobacteraceae bacterium]|nr:hypothetical protein [Desulfobacteraceae bacterium]
MELKKIGIVILFCLLLLGCESISRHDEFRSLQIGEPVPGFTATSRTGKEIRPDFPVGKFFIHFIEDQMGLPCLDLECGKEAESVVEKEGHLHAAGDGKLAKLFGVKLVSSSPWKFDTSLMVVTDGKGQILAIYENAGLEDIDEILKELEL